MGGMADRLLLAVLAYRGVGEKILILQPQELWEKCCDSLEGVELCGTAQGLAAGTGGNGPAGSRGRCTRGLCKAAPRKKCLLSLQPDLGSRLALLLPLGTVRWFLNFTMEGFKNST